MSETFKIITPQLAIKMAMNVYDPLHLVGGSTTERVEPPLSVKERRRARGRRESTPEEEEPYYNCSVDACGNKAPLSRMEFLPKDNVPEAVEMVLLCKRSVHEQNIIIQSYLEAHYLYLRPDWRTAKEWPRRIPFRICNRHFTWRGRPTNLPKPVDPAWRTLVDLISRKNLFHMYGVNRPVPYPINDRGEAGAKIVALGTTCNIPGCSSNLIEADPISGMRVRLYPIPFDDSIRHMWSNSITQSLGLPFLLPATGYVCQKHFARGGRVVQGYMEFPSVFDQKIREHLASELTMQSVLSKKAENVCRLVPADKSARDTETKFCMVRGCPISSKSLKHELEEYQLFQLPDGQLGDRWIRALRQANSKFVMRALEKHYVCERHFRFGPDVEGGAVPSLHLNPFEANMNKAVLQKFDQQKTEEVCICCKDVEMCGNILRRFNTKMNTLMQHVNMLCVLEGVKEVIPRPFNDHDDDVELYGDSEKVAVLAGVRAASMFVREAKGELAAMGRTLNSMQNSPARRQCMITSCLGSSKQCRMVDQQTFEDELKDGELILNFPSDIANARRMLAKGQKQIAICEKHRAEHIDNMALEFEDDDNEEVEKMKRALALPVGFQPKYGKRRRVNEEEEEAPKVKVEVLDDEEEDERLLSNNELLQRLLGGAIAGQVTGEIGDNGEVYEGGEEEAEMDELDNQEPVTTEDEGEDGGEEEKEKEADEDSNGEPPELN